MKNIELNITKIIEDTDNVPRLEFFNNNKKISQLNGVPLSDDECLQSIVILRHLFLGIRDSIKDREKIELLLKNFDRLYFYGNPQFYKSISEINDIKKLKFLYKHYKCQDKRKNIIRRLKLLNVNVDKLEGD